jgi:hypothetical protein
MGKIIIIIKRSTFTISTFSISIVTIGFMVRPFTLLLVSTAFIPVTGRGGL